MAAMTMFRRAPAWIAAAALLSTPVGGQAQAPRTGGEQANFERHTSHDEMMAYLHDVQSRTDRMRVRALTTTNQGRTLPLVLLGDPPVATPGSAFFSGKPLVFITGNVHGVERAGREGTLQLIRELALGGAGDLLDRVNVLIVPSLNPDGAENRTRTNSLGYDMNRDFIVAETPEITAIVEEVLTQWWPDVFVDVHNGGAYPYNLTYQATLHPGADADLVRFARGPMFEAVKAHMEQRDMSLYWYSGPRRDDATGEWSWYTTPPWARKQHTYGGLQNMITLLYEIPGRWTLGEQADNAREGLIGLIRFVADNADAVRSTVVEARRRTIESPPDSVPVTVVESVYPQPEQFFVMQNGEPTLVTGRNRTLFVATKSRAWPRAYAFDANLGKVASFLRRHGIEVERLETAAELRVEQFRLDSIAWQPEPYQNHLNARAAVTVVPAAQTLPAGTYIVRMTQNGARLVAELMEPDTDDSLLVWNFLDHALPSQQALQRREQPFLLPIYRLPDVAGLRSRLIE
jgi:dipeptidyl-peptidase 4